MPATDKYWRPIKRMHVIFAFSCLVMLLVTLWMMSADHDREWKPVQQTNERIGTLRLQVELYRKGALSEAEVETLAAKLTPEQREELGIDPAAAESEYAGKRDALRARVEKAEKALADNEAELDPLRDEERELKTRFDKVSVKQKVLKAQLDKAAADRGLAVRDELPEEVVAARQQEFDMKQEEVRDAVLEVERAEAALDEKRAEIAVATTGRNELQAELKVLQADEQRLRDARNKLDPETTLGWLKRKSMEWPILDGFNSHLRIRQDWLPDLDITLGMATTARFDRCRTCHLNVDAVVAGGAPAFPAGHPESDDYRDWVAKHEYPQPYSTHPRPDVYLTAVSPHPVTTFGCTICHQGNGSGTSFQAAEHGPNEPHEEHEWAGAHGYHPNHFWEYPMLPERFVESSCIKCHHDVLELAVNPTYGPTAPKVVEGFRTMAEYGCFGCHEVHGYDGDERIGPDLRAEPNYTAAAAQLLVDPVLQATLAPPASVSAEHVDRVQAELTGRQEALATMLVDPLIDQSQKSAAVGDLLRWIAEVAPPIQGSIPSLAASVIEEPDRDDVRVRLRGLVLAADALAIADERYRGRIPAADDIAVVPHPEVRTRALAAVLDDQKHPGKFRKVGPSLRHVGSKTSQGWLEFWTEEPKRFRPSTRMPQFWDLTNQRDDHGQNLKPVEVAAVAQYLMDKSQSSNLLAPAADYVPDVERGATFFSQKGCLACHQIGMFPGGQAEFGPDLSRVFAKIKPGFKNEDGTFDVGSEGFRWLYTWILDPERHHPRTKMPNLYVNEIRENETPAGDPAADIAAFLLTSRYEVVLTKMPAPGDDFDEILEIVGDEALGMDPETQRDSILPYLTDLPKTLKVVTDEESLQDLLDDLEDLADLGATVESRQDEIGEQFSHEAFLDVDDATLDELVELLVRPVLSSAQRQEFFDSRTFPQSAASIKGDEIELAGEAPKSAEEWRLRRLNYVGRKTISRYGCFGCHDVPGFETARPIGTVLQDWGRKDTSKLAVEHIHEYLKHHGEPDGGSTEERVESAIARSRGGEYETEEEAAEALQPAFFYESLLHHGRAGFLWQKLRQPRSYDYQKIETKGYDERLRMPKFPFDEQQIESIATFVLGLVADPPPTDYVYHPDARATDRIEGEFLLEKYNCIGCHYTELPRVRVAVNPDGQGNFTSFESLHALATNPEANFYEPSLQRMIDLKPIRNAHTGRTAEGKSIIEFHGLLDLIMVDPAEDSRDIEWNSQTFTTWENLDVGLKSLRLEEFARTTLPDPDAEPVDEAAPAADEDVPVAESSAWKLRFNMPITTAAAAEAVERRLLEFEAEAAEAAERAAEAIPADEEQESDAEERKRYEWTVRAVGTHGPGTTPEEFVVPLFDVMWLEIVRTQVFEEPTEEEQEADAKLTDEERSQIADEEAKRSAQEFEVLVNRALEATRARLANGETRLVTVDSAKITVAPADVLEVDEGRGGAFAQVLVAELLGSDPATSLDSAKKQLAWQSVPPPLVGEGHKVQTEWLYRFLRNPERLRRMTVLRMPRFNTSQAEARTLANYFAARDGAPYPYQNLEQRDPDYLAGRGHAIEELTGEPVNYLEQSWQLLHDKKCYTCHQYGASRFNVPITLMKDTRGPNLAMANARLRPEWLEVWLAKPTWMLPYTGMPVNFGKSKETSEDDMAQTGDAPPENAAPAVAGAPMTDAVPMLTTFGGRPELQLLGVRDALLNYYEALAEFGTIEVVPPAAEGATDPMGNPAEAAPPETEVPDAANPAVELPKSGDESGPAKGDE